MFSNAASKFVYVRTYSRWIDELGRRETWEETVDRYVNFIKDQRGTLIPPKVLRKIRASMLRFEVMPSMRAVWAAGEAAIADNTTMYNCSFQCIDAVTAFAENLYILMCGTGYGFRNTQKYAIENLPIIPQITADGAGVHVVHDSKSGWADSVKALFAALLSGRDLTIDYSKVRPKGARLKTMGGRASGPEPLMTLHNFLRDTLVKAQGRKLTSIEVHDICCQTAEIVIVGGVRRSSEIGLSDLSDEHMRDAKSGVFPLRRFMSNNSAVYERKPSAIEFLKEWTALASSGSGERGIFNLEAARRTAPKRRVADLIMGTNPCGEIMLRNRQFCNLSEAVARTDDDLDSLLEKVETATWIGVIQSTFTYFPYLSKEWQENCEEERLLGVSLTGQMDAPHLFTPEALQALKSRAVKVAKRASQVMGVNMPAAITCVKPSGTVSQLVDCASGLHTRHAKFYIRRYRISSSDPLFKMMKDQGIKLYPEVGQRQADWVTAATMSDPLQKCTIYRAGEKWNESKVNTWVVEFPVASPNTAITRNQMTAIEQLEHYKKLQLNWCEHNASCTVYVKDAEWFEVGNWVYKNWDIVNGVSFLPHDGGKYELAPYEEITEEQYSKLVKNTTEIDYTQLSKYELEDNTQGSQSYACASGVCELN